MITLDIYSLQNKSVISRDWLERRTTGRMRGELTLSKRIKTAALISKELWPDWQYKKNQYKLMYFSVLLHILSENSLFFYCAPFGLCCPIEKYMPVRPWPQENTYLVITFTYYLHPMGLAITDTLYHIIIFSRSSYLCTVVLFHIEYV